MKTASIKDRAMLAAIPTRAMEPSASIITTELPKTSPGMMMAHLERESKTAQENAALKSKLAGWAEATPAQKLDPVLIKPSLWANRHEKSFTGPAWDAFKDEISSAGGNVQPIKVRGVHPVNTLPYSYEIVFGHRRHRACLELGFSVLALVEDVSDKELFEQMDRENRQRSDLTVYEQGEMYRRALDEGLYPSLRKLSESLGVALGGASGAVTVARLPVTILDVFESRLDIQRRWAAPLTEALQKDPDVVLARASAIQTERAQGNVVKSAEVFKRLTSYGLAPSAPVTRSVAVKGRAPLQITCAGGRFKFELDALDAATAQRVEAAILKVLAPT